jgi:hypothetical protein
VLVQWADFTPIPDTHRATRIRFRDRLGTEGSELNLTLA